ncbi:MAG: DUF1444 family protein [Phycisphaerales bacterium]|nr:DUF1444 family protein [Phycisphaerales bacterium]
MPRELEAFAEKVVTIIARTLPDMHLELSGPCEVLLNGKRLDLTNVYRMVNQAPDHGVEIVEQYLDHIMTGEAVASAPLPLDMARDRIMPRIQPVSIFDHLNEEMVAYIPFVNDTVVTFVIDLPQMTVSISTEQMLRWGLDADDLDELARANLARYAPNLSLRVISSDEGGRAALFDGQDGYDAARLLLGALYGTLAPELGGDFLVATPCRDVLVAFTCKPNEFVDRLRHRVDSDYRKLPYPITNRIFYVTRDGIAGNAAA